MLTVFLLARIGQDGKTSLLVSPINYDEVWLNHLTVTAWLIINPIIIVGIILDTPMDWKLVSILCCVTHLRKSSALASLKLICLQDSLFSMVGAFLYIASGSCVVDSLNNDAGLAMGSLAIITGNTTLSQKEFDEISIQGLLCCWMPHFWLESMQEEKCQRACGLI